MKEEETATIRPTLVQWFLAAFRIGLLSFGGGLSGWMMQEFVLKRLWMTEAQFITDLSVSRIFPGATMTNFLVIVGHRLLGPFVSAVGLIGLLAGPFLVVIGMLQIFSSIDGPILGKALEGAAAAAVGLIAFIFVRSLHTMGRRWTALLVLGAVTVSVTVFHVPLLVLLVIAFPVSLLLNGLDRRYEGR